MENSSQSPLQSEEIASSNLPKTNRRKTFKTFAVILISLFALFVSLYQTRILVQQTQLNTESAKAQLWPRVNLDFGGVFSTEIASYEEVWLKMTNVGIGPAIIQDFQIEYKGEEFSSWWSLCQYLLPNEVYSSSNFSMTNANPTNQVIQAGESITVFALAPQEPTDFQVAFEALVAEDGPQISCCYQSVFKDSWVINGLLSADLLAEEGSCE